MSNWKTNFIVEGLNSTTQCHYSWLCQRFNDFHWKPTASSLLVFLWITSSCFFCHHYSFYRFHSCWLSPYFYLSAYSFSFHFFALFFLLIPFLFPFFFFFCTISPLTYLHLWIYWDVLNANSACTAVFLCHLEADTYFTTYRHDSHIRNAQISELKFLLQTQLLSRQNSKWTENSTNLGEPSRC